jgi:Zn-dependent alcohol dehydrogenase
LLTLIPKNIVGEVLADMHVLDFLSFSDNKKIEFEKILEKLEKLEDVNEYLTEVIKELELEKSTFLLETLS